MNIECKVKSINPLAKNTFRILLQPLIPVDYRAGQYLMVVMGEDDKRPFSIASSPCRHTGELELHIGAAEHNDYAIEVVELMKQALNRGENIIIDAPHGEAWLQEDQNSSILLVAGGTGFSYVRSILDHCISQGKTQPIYLYWGAKDSQQLYAIDELNQIAQQHDNIQFIPVVENPETHWQGKVGNVLQSIDQDFDSLIGFDIYIAGRFEMAGAAREQFVANKQADINRMYADAYSFM